MIQMVQIDLKPEEQALFLAFRRQQDVWTKLVNSKALEVKDGCVVLHFDHQGVLRKIERHDNLFST